MSIGSRIKALRKSERLTQKEFAESICVSQAYLSGVEADKENPSKALLLLIELKYNVSPDWLYNGAGGMYKWDSGESGCMDSDFYNKPAAKSAIEFIWHAEITQEHYEEESLKNIYDWLLSIAKQDAERKKYKIIDDKINVSFNFQKDKKLVFITVTQNVLF